MKPDVERQATRARGRSPATPEVAPRWAHAPQQARSQKTMQRTLDAAERILVERGLDAVTIPEVVRVAGSSVGAFYARFPDKRALLETLHERACEETLARADALLGADVWAERSLREILRAGVVLAVEVFGSRRNIMNAFAVTFAGDAGFARRRATTTARVAEGIAKLVLSRRDEISHPHPKRAISLALRVVTATLEQRNAFDASGVDAGDISDATLVEELERMLAAYLGVAAN